MELQFYAPGYVAQFEGFGCTATQYCAAMTIDSFSSNQNTDPSKVNDNGTPNNADCNNYILGGDGAHQLGVHHPQWQSQAPANPLFTGTFDEPELRRGQPERHEGPVHEPG